MPHKSVLQECLTRVSYKSVTQECRTRVSYKSVTQECRTRVSYKSVTQECLTRVLHKSAIQTRLTRFCINVRVSIRVRGFHLVFVNHRITGKCELDDLDGATSRLTKIDQEGWWFIHLKSGSVWFIISHLRLKAESVENPNNGWYYHGIHQTTNKWRTWLQTRSRCLSTFLWKTKKMEKHRLVQLTARCEKVGSLGTTFWSLLTLFERWNGYARCWHTFFMLSRVKSSGSKCSVFVTTTRPCNKLEVIRLNND